MGNDRTGCIGCLGMLAIGFFFLVTTLAPWVIESLIH
jgi:hypothetical protein